MSYKKSCARVGKMHKQSGLLGVLAILVLLPSLAVAQQPVRWEATFESAQRQATMSNRLVLVYFWADWCSVCKRMEAEVLSQAPPSPI